MRQVVRHLHQRQRSHQRLRESVRVDLRVGLVVPHAEVVRHLHQRQRSHQRLRESVSVDSCVRLVVPHTGRGAHLERNKRLPKSAAPQPLARASLQPIRVDMPVVEAHTWGSGLTLLLRSCAMLLSSMSLHPERQLDAYGRDMWRHFGAQACWMRGS